MIIIILGLEKVMNEILYFKIN